MSRRRSACAMAGWPNDASIPVMASRRADAPTYDAAARTASAVQRNGLLAFDAWGGTPDRTQTCDLCGGSERDSELWAGRQTNSGSPVCAARHSAMIRVGRVIRLWGVSDRGGPSDSAKRARREERPMRQSLKSPAFESVFNESVSHADHQHRDPGACRRR